MIPVGDIEILLARQKSELLAKLREEVEGMQEELTDTQFFMRKIATFHCGCSFYERCEQHKGVPLPEPTFTKSQVLALLEKEMK